MTNAMNFSGGPGALPASVLSQTRDAIEALPETGISVLGMSHRSAWFREVLDEAERNLRQLLGIPANYHVLFLQGGSSLQFSMLPMNFLRGTGKCADYIVSGYWSAKAPKESMLEGDTRVIWNGQAGGYRRLPRAEELRFSPGAAYLHYVSNETVEGLEFSHIPGLPDVPLVCDMSSNLLAGPISVERYAMIYAHAQKNLGPSGVTVVIIRDDLARSGAPGLPTLLDYRTHIEARSIYNTPPVFSIYVLMLVTRWLQDEIGGLDAMAEINRAKAAMVYEALDMAPDFYRTHSEPADRSIMNVAFSLRDKRNEARFFSDATRQGFYGLDGHRSIGGMRASLYNAVTLDAASALSEWLVDWARERSVPDRMLAHA